MRMFAVLTLLGLLAGCDELAPSADQTQREQQEQLSAQSNAQVGMPGITRFTEKRMMKRIMELRDAAIATYAYIPDFQGRLWHLCDSIGYGLPYATQYTNPSYIADRGANYGYAVLPQADPNGLFMPGSAEGTWIACAAAKAGDFEVVYAEPRVIVSPFKLRAEGEYQDIGKK